VIFIKGNIQQTLTIINIICTHNFMVDSILNEQLAEKFPDIGPDSSSQLLTVNEIYSDALQYI
jgi:hypothetical protein